jgi:CopG family nickel-responsive transcriptional regulator
MSGLIRFGISLDKELSEKFDELIRRKSYTNRSEAIRDLIRQDLVEQEWLHGSEVAGAITLIYNHHKRELLTEHVHNWQGIKIKPYYFFA